MRPSVTSLVCLLFVGYVGHSLWTLASLYFPPTCTPHLTASANCIHAHLATKPNLQLLLFTSQYAAIQRDRQLALLDRWTDVKLDRTRDKQYLLQVPARVTPSSAEGVWFLHAFLYSGDSDVVSDKDWRSMWHHSATTHAVVSLSLLHRPAAHTFNLLSPEQQQQQQQQHQAQKRRRVGHVRSQVPFLMLAETSSLPANKLSADVAAVINHRRLPTGRYLPVLVFDRLSSLTRDLVEVKPTSREVNITVVLNPVSLGKFRLLSQFDASMDSMKRLGFSDSDLDDVKALFTDTNMALLSVTMVVAALHILFDILAFKGDIQFWRSRASMAGISRRAILWRAVSHSIVLLSLADQRTSLLVLVPLCVATVIEWWKVVRCHRVRMLSVCPPRFTIDVATDGEDNTAQLDSQATRWLGFLLAPVCLLAAGYSLLYVQHKSWYSWCVDSAVNGVYAFGFLFMLPQLFINYKLKSVAHLPWRALMYKAFNTFIDDLFAFIVVMPTAHRVACFRDDLVFLIYLLQRWMYPVDGSRVDTAGSMEDTASGSLTDKKRQ